jgi:hypothetical protein
MLRLYCPAKCGLKSFSLTKQQTTLLTRTLCIGVTVVNEIASAGPDGSGVVAPLDAYPDLAAAVGSLGRPAICAGMLRRTAPRRACSLALLAANARSLACYGLLDSSLADSLRFFIGILCSVLLAVLASSHQT